MREYNVSCLHKGRPLTYVSTIVTANNEMDAIVRFMNWHEKQFKHRRAYDVQCAERPTEIHLDRMPRLGLDLSCVDMSEAKDTFLYGSTHAVHV